MEILKANEKAKYNYINRGRVFRPVTKHNFDYNDPLKIYFTLIEYGMNKDLSFQRTLIDLLKKKNLIEDKDANRRRTTVVYKKDEKEIQSNFPSQTISTNQTESTVSNTISISNDEKKILEEILSSNIKEITTSNMSYQRINTTIMEEIFSENVESIIAEIEKFENTKEDKGFDKIKFFLKEKERLDNNITNLIQQLNEYEKELIQLKHITEDNNSEIFQSNEEIQKLTRALEENVKLYIKIIFRD
jgi:hypothetical protein